MGEEINMISVKLQKKWAFQIYHHLLDIKLFNFLTQTKIFEQKKQLKIKNPSNYYNAIQIIIIN
jgi:hypothetical protein